MVDPTEFDRPAPHWRSGSMPGLPLAFERGPAKKLANVWQEAYNKEVRDNEHLTVSSSTRFVRSLLQPDGGHAVLFQRDEGDSQVQLWAEFDFVLNCTGPGVEQISLEGSKHASYRGCGADCEILQTLHGEHLAAAKHVASLTKRETLPDFARLANVHVVHSRRHFSRLLRAQPLSGLAGQ